MAAKADILIATFKIHFVLCFQVDFKTSVFTFRFYLPFSFNMVLQHCLNVKQCDRVNPSNGIYILFEFAETSLRHVDRMDQSFCGHEIT